MDTARSMRSVVQGFAIGALVRLPAHLLIARPPPATFHPAQHTHLCTERRSSSGCDRVQEARKEGSRGPLSEQFVNGPVPKNGTQLQKGKSGVGATSERAIGRGGWNQGCATPYGTALYRTWGQGQQPSGLSPGSAKGPSDGRWNSHVFPSSSMGSSVSHRVWGVETRLGMVSEGGLSACPGSRRVPPCRA